MKKLLLMVLAFAIQAGLHAQSLTEPTTILTKTTSGGFVHPDWEGWEHKIALLSNGQVISYHRSNLRSPWLERELAVLNHSVLQKIYDEMATINAGEITFSDTPECTDLPTTTYKIYQGSEEIIMGMVRACRRGILQNSYEAEKIMNLLDSFSALENF